MFVRVHHMQTTKYIDYWMPVDTSTAVFKLLDNFTEDPAAGALLMGLARTVSMKGGMAHGDDLPMQSTHP